MTDKQYEHLGKAVEKLLKLAKTMEGLFSLRNEIERELSFFMDKEEARKEIECVLTDCLPYYRIGDVIKGIVEEN